MATGGVPHTSTVLDCAVCQTGMLDKHPRMLPCMHTFCQQCLTNLKINENGKSYITCPTCRKETVVPNGQTESLPENFPEKPHQMVLESEKSKFVGESAAEEMNSCQSHGSNHIEFWCKTCDEILCPLCVLDGKHFKHAIKLMEEELQEKLKVVLSQMENVQHMSELYRNDTVQLDHIIEKAVEIKDRVSYIGDLMKTIINSQVDYLLTKCEQDYIQPAKDQKSLLQRHTDILKALDENLSDCEKTKSLLQLHRTLPVVQSQLSEITKTSNFKSLLMPKYVCGSNVDGLSVGNIIAVLDDTAPGQQLSCKDGRRTEVVTASRRSKGTGGNVARKIPFVSKAPKRAVEISRHNYPDDVEEADGDRELACPHLVMALTDQQILQTYTVDDEDPPYGVLTRKTVGGSNSEASFYADSKIVAVIPQHKHVLVLEEHGLLSKRRLDDITSAIQVWHLGEIGVSSGAAVSNNQVVFSTEHGGILTFNLKSKRAQVKLTCKKGRIHVTCAGTGHSLVFCITHTDQHRVSLYSATWRLLTSFGGYGRGTGQLINPEMSLFLPTGNILVSDTMNHRITEFTDQGRLVRHWITLDDYIHPGSISFVDPYLWVVIKSRGTARYFIK